MRFATLLQQRQIWIFQKCPANAIQTPEDQFQILAITEKQSKGASVINILKKEDLGWH
jgi:hypothetical protein